MVKNDEKKIKKKKQMNNVFFAIFQGNPPYSIGKQTKKKLYI